MTTPPPPARLRGDPGAILLRPVLQLTLFFEPTIAWAHETAPALLRSFLRLRSHRPPRLFRVSSDARWRPLPDPPSELAEALAPSMFGAGLRPGFRLRIVDEPHAPSHAFVYREHDPEIGPPCGYLQVQLPFEADPDELLALAIEAAQTAPLDQGSLGYAWSWSEALPRNAFHAVARRAQRLLGVDVTHADRAVWHAHERLLTVSWLTLVGGRLAEALGLASPAALAEPLSGSGASVLELTHACAIRAGDRPDVGDVHAMDAPRIQAQVTRTLSPHLAGDVPALPGWFSEPDSPDDLAPEGRTAAFRRRLLLEGER